MIYLVYVQSCEKVTRKRDSMTTASGWLHRSMIFRAVMGRFSEIRSGPTPENTREVMKLKKTVV